MSLEDLDLKKMDTIFNDIDEEVVNAVVKYKPFNSAHEGYAVLLEEVDELWDEVKVKQGQRDMKKLYLEAKQVAAMAIRFMYDIATKDQV